MRLARTPRVRHAVRYAPCALSEPPPFPPPPPRIGPPDGMPEVSIFLSRRLLRRNKIGDKPWIRDTTLVKGFMRTFEWQRGRAGRGRETIRRADIENVINDEGTYVFINCMIRWIIFTAQPCCKSQRLPGKIIYEEISTFFKIAELTRRICEFQLCCIR